MIAPVVIREGGSLHTVPLGEALRRVLDPKAAIVRAGGLDIDAVVEAYRVGASRNAICKKYRLGDDRLLAILDAAGVPIRGAGTSSRETPAMVALVVGDRRAGLTAATIATTRCIPVYRVKRILRRAGETGRLSKIRYHEPEILRRLAGGERCATIAADLHVSRCAIERVLRQARADGVL